jgi:hypothetical protein
MRVVAQFPESPHRLQGVFETGQILVSQNKRKRPRSCSAGAGGRRVIRGFQFALNHLAAIASQRKCTKPQPAIMPGSQVLD